MAKLNLFLLAVLAIAVIRIEANARTQIFGRKSETSDLFDRKIIKHPALGGNTVAEAEYSWFERVGGKLRRIGAVVVSHQGRGEGATARITYGGPGNTEVIVRLKSAPGRPIDSEVQLWTQ